MMWTRARWSLAIVSSLALAATNAAAQGGTGRVSGTVTDRTAGAPIPNVSVNVLGTQLGARTGPDGRFAIENVPVGSQRLHAARIGYTPIDQLVTIAAGQLATSNIALSAATV